MHTYTDNLIDEISEFSADLNERVFDATMPHATSEDIFGCRVFINTETAPILGMLKTVHRHPQAELLLCEIRAAVDHFTARCG